MPLQTTKETFKGYSVDSKLNTLFDIAIHSQACQAEQRAVDITRFEKLEKRKKFDTAVAASTGILGGFTAMIAKFMFYG